MSRQGVIVYHVRHLRLCSCQNRNLTEHHEKSIARLSPVPDDNVHHKDAVRLQFLMPPMYVSSCADEYL